MRLGTGAREFLYDRAERVERAVDVARLLLPPLVRVDRRRFLAALQVVVGSKYTRITYTIPRCRTPTYLRSYLVTYVPTLHPCQVHEVELHLPLWAGRHHLLDVDREDACSR